MVSMGETIAGQKEHKGSSKKHLDDLQDLGENILWTDETKVEHSGSFKSCYIWWKANAAFHVHV